MSSAPVGSYVITSYGAPVGNKCQRECRRDIASSIPTRAAIQRGRTHHVFPIAMTRGNPARLTAHGDFKGAKCGMKENWNPYNSKTDGTGWDLEGIEKKMFAWNVHGKMGIKMFCVERAR